MKKKPKKVTGKKKHFLFFLNLGKVMMDLGKLCFASLVLGVIIRGEIPQAILAIGGLVIAIALLAAGVLLVTKKEKNGENESAPEKKE